MPIRVAKSLDDDAGLDFSFAWTFEMEEGLEAFFVGFAVARLAGAGLAATRFAAGFGAGFFLLAA